MPTIVTELYTVDDLMARYGKSRATILRWARDKKIGSTKPNNGSYFFTAAHIAEFETASETTTPARVATRPKRNPNRAYKN